MLRRDQFVRADWVPQIVVAPSQPSNISAEVAMIENFGDIGACGDTDRWSKIAAASLKTQEYLDAIWVAAA